MWRYIFFSAFVLAMLALVSCSSGGTEQQAVASGSDSLQKANLVFIDDFFDFGTIAEGEVVSHVFRFRNSGSAVLIIKDVIPSCGCTSSRLSSKMLKPGEEGSIEVIFDSRGWYGSQYKSLALRTNSPIMDKSVTIKANVVERNGR